MIKKSIVINITVKKGTPKVNFLFLVLWWNKYIPKREPIPPPISENNNNKLYNNKILNKGTRLWKLNLHVVYLVIHNMQYN